MKIVCMDNFARETVSEKLVAENVPEFYAKAIAEFLNSKFGGEEAPNWYVAKPDDYQLYKYDPT